MLKIIKQENRLLLEYRPDRDGADWIDNDLQAKGYVTIRRVFTFGAHHLVQEDNEDHPWEGDVRTFVLGHADGEFYQIERDILGLKHDLLLHKEMTITSKTFIATRDISIFRKIDRLIDEEIVIGGDAEGSVPIDEFVSLLNNFPTTTELTHYANARISRSLQDYFGTMSDAQKKLDSFLNRKRTIKTPSRVGFLKEYEPRKFEYIRDELNNLLKESEGYDEKDWQKLIVNFLLLIFPKYIAVLENLHIKDFYAKPGKVTPRYIDFTLVDADGTVDIIEIKKPFSNCLLSKRKYRDSYTPKMELSGSVMQVEKYIFHLQKWGRDGERAILEKRKDELPSGLEIKVTNPKAMIILGRDSDFVDDQKFDFEIIRRKYANVIDIMTYDDLLRRLDNIISMLVINHARLDTLPKKKSGLAVKEDD
jgi:hypothetical protein